MGLGQGDPALQVAGEQVATWCLLWVRNRVLLEAQVAQVLQRMEWIQPLMPLLRTISQACLPEPLSALSRTWNTHRVLPYMPTPNHTTAQPHL